MFKADDMGNYRVSACIGGKWVMARPLSPLNIVKNIKYAWLVFTGKADVLVWHDYKANK